MNQLAKRRPVETFAKGCVEYFSDTLNDVYGSFCVAENEFGTHGAEWRRTSGIMLSAAEVVVAGLDVSRPSNALKAEHRDVVFVLLQLSGHQVVEHCRGRKLLRQGDLAFVSHRDAIRLRSDAPNRVLAAHLPLDIIRTPDLSKQLYGRRFCGQGLRAQLFSDILLRLTRPGPADMDDGGAYAQSVLNAAWSGLAGEAAASGRTPSFDRLEDHVRSNLADPDLDVQNLCRDLGLSARTLYRRCQEQGLSPSAWLWRMRLDTARDRLRSPAWRHLSVTEISQSVGFADSAHFSRSFKRAYGISPKAWSKG